MSIGRGGGLTCLAFYRQGKQGKPPHVELARNKFRNDFTWAMHHDQVARRERSNIQEPAPVDRLDVDTAVAAHQAGGLPAFRISLVLGNRVNHLAHQPFTAIQPSIAVGIPVVANGPWPEVVEHPRVRNSISVSIMNPTVPVKSPVLAPNIISRHAWNQGVETPPAVRRLSSFVEELATPWIHP